MLAMICGASARSRVNGPPGAKRIRKKEMVTTIRIVGTALSSRLRTKRSIYLVAALAGAGAADEAAPPGEAGYWIDMYRDRWSLTALSTNPLTFRDTSH